MSDYDDCLDGDCDYDYDTSHISTCQYCGCPVDDDFFIESCPECAREAAIDSILDRWD